MADPSGIGLRGDVRVEADQAAVARAVAEEVVAAAGAAMGDHGEFCIALAGGGIAQVIHETLATDPFRERTDWSRWRVFFGDERAVPPDDSESNHHQARRSLLDRVPMDDSRIHRMRGEEPDLNRAAAEYAELLEALLPHDADGAPRLDCILLGLGTNGHTASLFPGTSALEVSDTWATRGRADYAPYDRITLTFPAINAAGRIVFAVTGADKREALRAVASGAAPAARVAPRSGSLLWFLDAPASNG